MRLARRSLVVLFLLPGLYACALPHKVPRVHATGRVPVYAAETSGSPIDFPSSGAPDASAAYDAVSLAAAEAGSSARSSIGLAPPGRQMIHVAQMTVRVANREVAMRRLETIAAEGGGPIYSLTLGEMTFGVPPARLRTTLDEVAELGEVVSRSLSAEDVTDRFVDLRLRLEVAQKARQRLVALLEARGDIKEILEVERDIRRLTEEIESIEGTLRSLEDRVAFSRITVTLTERAAPIPTPAPPARRGVGGILPWVADSGVDSVLRSPPPDPPLDGGRGRWGLHGPKFRLATDDPERVVPDGFLPVLHDRETLLAATASDDRLRVRFLEMPKSEAELDFWAEAALHELRDYRGYRPRVGDGEGDSESAEPASEPTANPVETLAMDRPELVGRAMRFVAGERGREWLYDIYLVAAPGASDRLIVAEFAREKRSTDPLSKAVEDAVRGLRSGSLRR